MSRGGVRDREGERERVERLRLRSAEHEIEKVGVGKARGTEEACVFNHGIRSG